MVKPTVHLNGTGARDLFNGYMTARDAVQSAYAAMCKVEFNARDYYPQGPSAWAKAQNDWQDRLRFLHTLSSDLLELAGHVQDNARPGALD